MGEPTRERRDLTIRALVIQHALETAVRTQVTLTSETLQSRLGIPADAADRILLRLASSGVIREIQRGIWVRSA